MERDLKISNSWSAFAHCVSCTSFEVGFFRLNRVNRAGVQIQGIEIIMMLMARFMKCASIEQKITFFSLQQVKGGSFWMMLLVQWQIIFVPKKKIEKKWSRKSKQKAQKWVPIFLIMSLYHNHVYVFFHRIFFTHMLYRFVFFLSLAKCLHDFQQSGVYPAL